MAKFSKKSDFFFDLDHTLWDFEKNSDLIQENQKQNLEVVNQIKELKDLHDKGILNDEEFQKAKEKLLM